MIHVKHLSHHVSQAFTLTLPQWQLSSGQHCLVLGPSGSGKSTLLNLLAGFMVPTSGSVMIDGKEISKQRDKFRGQVIGNVFQALHLIKALTVMQNLKLARSCAGLLENEAHLRDILDSLGLKEKADQLPSQLSQGEQQRVAIARAVVNQPKVILADEPTSALDDRNCQRVTDLLLAQAQVCGASLVIATHDHRLKDRIGMTLELGDFAQ